jgi:hypothetical protein
MLPVRACQVLYATRRDPQMLVSAVSIHPFFLALRAMMSSTQ